MPVTIISKDRNVNPVLISCDKLFRNSHIFVEVVHLLEEIFLQQWSKRIISDWQSEPLIKQNFWPTTSCANHRQRPRESNKNINFIMCALTKKKTDCWLSFTAVEPSWLWPSNYVNCAMIFVKKKERRMSKGQSGNGHIHVKCQDLASMKLVLKILM